MEVNPFISGFEERSDVMRDAVLSPARYCAHAKKES
jgi:hypothetical protein